MRIPRSGLMPTRSLENWRRCALGWADARSGWPTSEYVVLFLIFPMIRYESTGRRFRVLSVTWRCSVVVLWKITLGYSNRTTWRQRCMCCGLALLVPSREYYRLHPFQRSTFCAKPVFAPPPHPLIQACVLYRPPPHIVQSIASWKE